jgi:hypothetical protein
MQLGRLFFSTFSLFICLWASFGYGDNRADEIKKIDLRIQELEEMKRGYEARALKHDTMAEYLQFDQQAVLETRRHLQLADENRKKAALVQEEIDRLQKRRLQLIK